MQYRFLYYEQKHSHRPPLLQKQDAMSVSLMNIYFRMNTEQSKDKRKLYLKVFAILYVQI